jgi:hypothetical protein
MRERREECGNWSKIHGLISCSATLVEQYKFNLLLEMELYPKIVHKAYAHGSFQTCGMIDPSYDCAYVRTLGSLLCHATIGQEREA